VSLQVPAGSYLIDGRAVVRDFEPTDSLYGMFCFVSDAGGLTSEAQTDVLRPPQAYRGFIQYVATFSAPTSDGLHCETGQLPQEDPSLFWLNPAKTKLTALQVGAIN